jgi:hypothetical protein
VASAESIKKAGGGVEQSNGVGFARFVGEGKLEKKNDIDLKSLTVRGADSYQNILVNCTWIIFNHVLQEGIQNDKICRHFVQIVMH